MSKDKLLYGFAFAALLVLSGCYKDLGNYDYSSINTPTIQLEKTYTGFYGKNISIVPVIKLSMDDVANTYDTTKYAYEWSTINAGALYANQRVVLATTRNLNTTLSVPPGNGYTLYFRMTDKKTGVQWRAQATLNVTTNIYEGWLVLNDVNAKSRLDMLSLLNGSYTFLPGVLDSVGSGLSLDAKPVGVFYSPQAAVLATALTPGIYISTAAGTNRIDPENFKWDPTLNIKYQMLSNVPADFTAEIITPASSYTEYMYAGGNIYYYYRINQVNYGVPVNIMTGESMPFKAAPFMAVSRSNGAVFYDADHKRFVRQAFAASVCTPMPANMPLFDYTTGLDLTYMEYVPYNGGEVFAILKDPATGKSYLARFTYGASIQQTYYAEITGTDFNKAEQIAVNPDYGYVFYNVGGKVYEYDFGLKQSKLMLDKGNRPITLLKFQHFNGGKYLSGSTALYNKLIVGSYDPSLSAASWGTMDIYTVPGVNGNLVADNSYSGFGKIVSVTYRER